MNGFPRFCIALGCLALSACASIVSSTTQKLADNLSRAILNQNDMQTVQDGAPAYLIMIDSFVEGDPENPQMLRAGARLNGSYASAFVEDEARAARLALKAYDYAQRAACIEVASLCSASSLKLEALQSRLEQLEPAQQPVLYDFAVAWAGWIQANSSDWNALAQISKLNALFARSIELDETYERGSAHIYLGVLNSQIPPSLGGKPETGRAHFERALELSQGEHLMVKLLFAEHYARLVFDQELHDRLLTEIIDDNRAIDGLILSNTIARHRATLLLEESKDFF